MASGFNSMLFIFTLVLVLCTGTDETTSKPNIIFILVDDLGFNDLGYMGCTATSTPFIDSLANDESLILSTNYVVKVCSPSRASLLSGRYASHLGLQNLVFNPQYPVSLTRQVSLLSDEFKEAGYSTHMIGKWHLGMQSWEYTPTFRGFDTFNGFYGGWQSYFTHEQWILNEETFENEYYYDLRRDEAEDYESIKQQVYGPFNERDKAIEILSKVDREIPFFMYLAFQASHTPNEAPDDYKAKYQFDLKHPARISVQAQTTSLDDAMSVFITYLKDNNFWDNTLIIFSSDNGGEFNRGDNSPLRGYKNSSWEGGIRVPGFVTGGYLNDNRRGQSLDDVMVHITDWYPTLLSAAGVHLPTFATSKRLKDSELSLIYNADEVGTIHLDGHDLWDAIQYEQDNTLNEKISIHSREILLDLNDQYCEFESCGAIRIGDYKFIRGANIGTSDLYPDADKWDSAFSTCNHETEATNILGCGDPTPDSVGCHLVESGCLFDLSIDPCEYINLADSKPDIAQKLIQRLNYHLNTATIALITEDNQLDFTEYDPAIKCNSQFWCPFQSYSDAQKSFEVELVADYKRLYPVDIEDVINNDDKQSQIPFNILIVILSVLALFGVCFVIYINLNHSATSSKYMTDFYQMRHETAPLIQ